MTDALKSDMGIMEQGSGAELELVSWKAAIPRFYHSFWWLIDVLLGSVGVAGLTRLNFWSWQQKVRLRCRISHKLITPGKTWGSFWEVTSQFLDGWYQYSITHVPERSTNSQSFTWVFNFAVSYWIHEISFLYRSLRSESWQAYSIENRLKQSDLTWSFFSFSSETDVEVLDNVQFFKSEPMVHR